MGMLKLRAVNALIQAEARPSGRALTSRALRTPREPSLTVGLLLGSIYGTTALEDRRVNDLMYSSWRSIILASSSFVLNIAAICLLGETPCYEV